MTRDWQQLVALACVAVALIVLGRRVWRLWKGASQPGATCASCPVHEGSTAPPAKPLVALDLRLPSVNASQATHDGADARS